MDGLTSDRPHGSTGQGPGGLGRTRTKMIGDNDATNDGPSAEEYDEIAMVDEDVKRMIDLATKL